MAGRPGNWRSSIDRRRANVVVGIAALIVLVALALFAVQLSGTQSRARERALSSFHERARVISELTQAVLASASAVATSDATQERGVPTLSGPLLDRMVAQSNLAYAAMISQTGHVVVAWQMFTPTERAEALSSTALEQALVGAPLSLSDVLPGAGGGVVDFAVSLSSAVGQNVLVARIPTPPLNGFLGSCLPRVLTPGGTAYVLDDADAHLKGVDGRLLSDLCDRAEHVRGQLAAAGLDPPTEVGVLDRCGRPSDGPSAASASTAGLNRRWCKPSRRPTAHRYSICSGPQATTSISHIRGQR